MKIKNREFIIMDKMSFINYKIKKSIDSKKDLYQLFEKQWIKLSKGFNFVLKDKNEDFYYSVLYIHEEIRKGNIK